MVRFNLEQSNELLVTPSGLAMVGALLSRTELASRLNAVAIPESLDPNISNHENIFSYVGLLCQGKTAYEDIEAFRDNDFFRLAMGLQQVPSCSTLRQRFNYAGTHVGPIIKEEMVGLLKKTELDLTPCLRNMVPIDIDVSPFDNSKTKKEGVSRTYKGFDGYAPIFAYIGQEGYCLHSELRAGSVHCQKGTVEFLSDTIYQAKQLTDAPLLVRLDSGNDAKDNIKVLVRPDTKADFVIKRNLRQELPQDWLETASTLGEGTEEREGKLVYYGSIDRDVKGIEKPVRIVYKITERTITAKGQVLLIPDVEAETYWTSLPDDPEVVIAQYHDHGTSEQFHSEIKTDIGLERFPSSKFKTNTLILHLAVLAYNLLRIVGQESLKVDDAPVRKQVKRRRIRTVIQNLITIATKLVYHARQHTLKFGSQSAWFATFTRVYCALL